MYLIIIEPKHRDGIVPGERRYLADRIFFNFNEAYSYAQRRMTAEDVEAAIAEVQMPYLTKVELPGKKV